MSAIHDLEVYFAKKYTKKFAELGGSYYVGEDGTPLKVYFESGEYKELNDKKLDELYASVSNSRKLWKIITLGLSLVILVAYLWL